jgi:periplasmic divalent cation tolerance protein
MVEDPKAYLVLSTVGTNEEARKLAKIWVESGRAACVTRIPGAESLYRYKGKISEDAEVLLLIKTSWRTEDEGKELFESFIKDHPYEEPELIAFRVDKGSPGYLEWLLARGKRGNE